MNRSILLASLVLSCICSSLVAQETIRWQPDLVRARQLSNQYGVPMLVHFYGDNCLPCKALEQRVYSRPEVVQRMNTYFIPVRINASHDMKTAAEFHVHSWPTDVFVAPSGKILSSGVCQREPNAYMQVLQNAAISSNDHMMLANAQRPNQTSMPNAGIANQQNPYGQLPTGTTHPSGYSSAPAMGNQQPTLMNSATLQPTYPVSAPTFQPASQTPNNFVPSGQFGPLNTQNALPAQGQANVASTLASPSPASTVAGQLDLAQQNAIVRGPLAEQSQPQPLRGAIPGTAQNTSTPMKVAAPNLPSPAPVMQQEYAQRSAMTNQFAAIPAGRATTVPNELSAPTAGVQAGTAQWGMPNANSTNNRSRPSSNSFVLTSSATPNSGITLSNPHFNDVASTSDNNPSTLLPSQPTTTAPTDAVPAEDSVPVSEQSFQPASTRTDKTDSSISVENTNVTSPTVTGSSTPAAKALGLEGYCPVSLNDMGKWVEGDQAFAVKHRGKVYRMCSADAMNKFMALPDAYAPVLSGYDPMVFLDQGKLVDGAFDFGLVDETHPRTIYLFSSQENKDKFEKDFDANVKALNILLARTRPKR